MAKQAPLDTTLTERDSRHSEAVSEGVSQDVDSLVRAVAHVSTIDMAELGEALGQREGTVDAASEPAEFLPQVGSCLGRYQLTELLGRGGMGAVFAARHQGTGREVAVKVLLPSQHRHALSYERRARFVREAKAAGRIRHPNVVDVYDVDGASDPPFLVLERLHGESLWHCLKRGPMAPEEAVPLLLGAMDGVMEAHKQGVIHRDLKPDNIFLARGAQDASPVPKVLDFGVSRILSREGSEPRPTTITRAGYIVGTPSYMPLEQLRGQVNLDARVDVYALGVILYEALSGQRPYSADNDHELVVRMVTEPPKPLAEVAAKVDAALERIVLRALARDPDDRYPDVASFARALQGFIAGDRDVEPAQPRLQTAGSEAAAKSPDRTQLLSATLLVTLLALGGALWSLRARSVPAPPRAPLPAAAPPATSRPRSAELPRAAPPPPLEQPQGEAPSQVPAARLRAKASRPVRGSDTAPEPVRGDRATELKPEDF